MQNFRRIFTAVSILLACLLIYPFESGAAEKKKFVVVIDAGHGGSDHGAIENGVHEKDVNLAVALKLGAMIEKKLKDTEVVYTRNSDDFISLQKRADIANGSKADLFISIHCNSVDKSNKNRANVVGATTYVLGLHRDSANFAVARRENAVVELDANDRAHYSQYDPTSDESYIIFEMTQKKNLQNSVRFASDVQREMASAGRFSRGVQQAGFWVLWSTAMPAALIELDFICNPEQAKFLGSSSGQEKLAGAIFNAVKNYENYYRRSMGLAEGSSAPQGEYQQSAAQQPAPAAAAPSVAQAAPVATEVAELPAASDTERRQTTRQATPAQTPTRSGASTGAHRRRSASGRQATADQVEQTVIEITEEAAPPVAQVENAPHEESAPQASAQTQQSGKKAKKDSKPARRSRDQAPRRKARRDNVSIVYKVLLFSSDQELKANDEAFKGLSPVASFRENNLYNYTFGESADRNEMETVLDQISELFPDARIIKRYL